MAARVRSVAVLHDSTPGNAVFQEAERQCDDSAAERAEAQQRAEAAREIRPNVLSRHILARYVLMRFILARYILARCVLARYILARYIPART